MLSLPSLPPNWNSSKCRTRSENNNPFATQHGEQCTHSAPIVEHTARIPHAAPATAASYAATKLPRDSDRLRVTAHENRPSSAPPPSPPSSTAQPTRTEMSPAIASKSRPSVTSLRIPSAKSSVSSLNNANRTHQRQYKGKEKGPSVCAQWAQLILDPHPKMRWSGDAVHNPSTNRCNLTRSCCPPKNLPNLRLANKLLVTNS